MRLVTRKQRPAGHAGTPAESVGSSVEHFLKFVGCRGKGVLVERVPPPQANNQGLADMRHDICGRFSIPKNRDDLALEHPLNDLR